MKNNLYNTKVKLIRDIFDTIMNDGYMETKEDTKHITDDKKTANTIEKTIFATVVLDFIF